MNIIPKADDFAVSPQFAQRTLSYGLGLGALGSLLFLDILRPGLPILIWLTAFAMAAISLALRTQHKQVKTIVAWSLLAVAAAGVLQFYLNPVTFLLMIAMTLLAAAIVTMELRGIRLHDVSIYGFVTSGLRLPLQALTGCFALLGKIDIKAGVRSVNNPTVFSVLRGLIIALPLLLIFGALFSSADAAFERAFDRVLQFFGPDMPEHIVIAFCMGWLATGLLTTIASKAHDSVTTHPFRFRLGKIETTVVLGLLLAMFLLFVLLQVPYLFGGRETIESTSGLTLSEYARRGFFELVTVSSLALVVLLLIHGTSASPSQFRRLAIAILACLFLIIISAGQRLFLYMDSFGLTLSRLSASIFIIWLAMCLLLFTSSLLRRSDKGLVPGAVYSAVLLAFVFALLSPPQLVAKFNIEKAKQNQVPVDFHYLQSLGAETVPILLDEFDQLPEYGRCTLAKEWLRIFDLENTTAHDWRNWNYAYERARKALVERSEELTDLAAACCDQSLSALLNPDQACNLLTY